MTSTPFGSPSRGGSDDYFKPDDMRREWKRQNPGENFQKFLNKAEKENPGTSANSIREGLTTKAERAERRASRPQPKPAASKGATTKATTKTAAPKKPAPKKK